MPKSAQRVDDADTGQALDTGGEGIQRDRDSSGRNSRLDEDSESATALGTENGQR
jgi:hypothetical protein